MKYYSIRESLDKKIIGTYPQVVHANHNCHVWDEPKFIGQVQFKKIDYEPITSNAILEKKARPTDLISSRSIGFTLKLLLSGKLKRIIEKYSKNKCQFFQAPVIFKDYLINDYWLLSPYNFNMEFIDYHKSAISVRVRRIEGGTESKPLKADDYKEFMSIINNHKEKKEIVSIDNIILKDNVNEDFFLLNHRLSYIVSEKLKKEIENAQCTGIEFMPIEMKLTEWL